MIHSFIANHHRYKAYPLYILCVLLILFASGCGDQTSDQAKTAPSDTGAASFSIQWHSTATNRNVAGSRVHRAIEDCSALGIESISCDVYNESNTPIAHGGPWPCDAHGGRIESIPAGPDRTFAVLGWNGAGADGDVIYQGQTAGITIVPGEIADTGDIDAYPFIPQLSNPADGQTVTTNAFSLTWDSVPNAYGYRILVSEDSSFATPLVDERTTETTYAPSNLLPSTTYYWMIRSIDLYGNESADSQIRHFITSALQDCQAPVLDPIGNKQIDEGMPLSFIIDANDPDTDNDVLTYRVDNRPTGADFDPETRTFSWTPGHGTAGNYPVTFTVCDDCPEAPLCDSEQITISVGNVCLPPVLQEIGNQPVNEGQTLSFQLIASDPDTDIDALTYHANTNTLPPDADFDAETGTFSWTPGYDTTDNEPVTFEGVTFEVCDDCPGGSLCDSQEISITVVPAQPVAKILFLNFRNDITDASRVGYSELGDYLRSIGFDVEQASSEEIDASIEDYDIVVYDGEHDRYIADGEAQVLKNFVEIHGGGLLLMSDYGRGTGFGNSDLIDLNLVAEQWGIEFVSGMVCDDKNHYEMDTKDDPDGGVDYPYIYPTSNHPAVQDVFRFIYNWGGYLKVASPAIVVASTRSSAWVDSNYVYDAKLDQWNCTHDNYIIDEIKGSKMVMAAIEPGENGGKVIAIGDAEMWFNWCFLNYSRSLASGVFNYLSPE